MPSAQELYGAVLAQLAAESYLDGIDVNNRAAIEERLLNGNNHFLEATRPSILPPNAGLGSTRQTKTQRDEFFDTYEIVDHLPNQASGFSATILKNKATGEYTLAFRSTEYRDIENGGDAERDSIRGAAGDIAFNGMAFAQVSSMERYWQSLLDGSRALGATPDNSFARDTSFLRPAEIAAFTAAITSGTKINVSGYSLGGHLATTFGILHGEKVSSLYLFNSSGVGKIRQGFSADAYREALAAYDFYMRPENLDAAMLEVLDWASRTIAEPELAVGARLRMLAQDPRFASPLFSGERLFVPKEFQGYIVSAAVPMPGVIGGLISLAHEQALQGIPLASDGRPLLPSSAQHFLVSLFASEALEGTYAQTLARASGTSFPSLQESGFIPADVRIYQVSGLAAAGAPSVATLNDMLQASDWNIVADSGIRAAPDSELLSVYIEDQPVAAGLPFSDRGWGDFGNTHSITLIADSLAVLRMLQKAQPSLTQEAAEGILRAASNLRKEFYSVLPPTALTEHDTLERIVDAFGRVLFARTADAAVDWSQDLASADGISSFGLLEYRDPMHARIKAIEDALDARGLSGALEVVSLAGWSSAELAAAAGEATERGTAVRYALKELNPFYVNGAGLYEMHGRAALLALHDPVTGTGSITTEWIRDRAEFLALKIALGTADEAYAVGPESVAYTAATGAVTLSIAAADTSGLLAPSAPMSKRTRAGLADLVERVAASGRARKVMFGSDGDPAANPATAAGGAETLRGEAGADRLYGEGGNDKLYGGAGADYLEGGAGDDDLTGGTGSDVLAGGSGYDSYFWQLGDGFDRITDTREVSGQMRGRIVLRLDTSLLIPRVFERDTSAPIEAWRSPDRTLLLTHGATWTLSFPDGEIDLGADLRDGDFGFRLEDTPTPPPPTIIAGFVRDDVVVGPNYAGTVLVGEYGHDRLYADAPVALEAALLVAEGTPLAGWGIWVSAGPGDDIGIGSAADDILYGAGGDDILVGGPGDDLLESDADWLPVDGRSASWDYSPNPDEIFFTDFLSPDLVLVGTSVLESYREQLDAGNDIVYGGGGSDIIHGGEADDRLYGDSGDDILTGGGGSDVLFGGDGADHLTGELHGYAPVPFEIQDGKIITYVYYVSEHGDDIIDGGGGPDELTGEGGADVLFGGEGDDKLYGDNAGLPASLHGDDILDGGDGSDLLYGQGGNDVIFGGGGDDRLVGDSEIEPEHHGADRLRGDDGNDVLIGAGGDDELLGGSGDDTLVGDAFDIALAYQGADYLDGGAGKDTLYGLGGSDELYGGEDDDRLDGDDPDAPFMGDADFLDGGAGDDRLRGRGGDDRLHGGSGDDTLFGDAGNDILAGGPGSDVLDGGEGDNIYEFVAGDGADRVIAGSGAITIAFVDGVDIATLRATRMAADPAGVEPLRLEYGPGDAIVIESLDDLSRLRIRIGDADLLGGSELVQLSAAAEHALPGSLAAEILVADASRTEVFGFAGDDLIIGSDASDRLFGGSGDDTLFGLRGDDTLEGGEGADRLTGGSGDDYLAGGEGADRYELAPGEGIDSLVERAGGGFDVVALAQTMPLESIRLRRAGMDLVIAERAGSGRLFVRDWFAPVSEADRPVEAIVHAGGTLDVAAMVAREIADRTLLGTAAADTLTGDEFDDIIIGATGDDTLLGLAGDDRYLYTRGDGKDRIVESGGFDTVEFGPGIVAGEIEFVGTPDGSGGVSIEVRIAGEPALLFGDARAERVDAFEFASGEVYDYEAMLGRAAGLRLEGGDGDDVVPGTFFSDALYGFAGNDMLSADAGEDVLVGAEGDDVLAGGANDDTYVFNLGDGRDSVLEYTGTDEYLLFRGYFTASGQRAFDLDGVTFATHEPLPGAFGETFNITLGSVAGGNDTIRFGEGIAPEDVRFGLDLGKPLVPYSWVVPSENGGLVVGTAQAEQVAYVLEVGTSGDAIEILWPNVEIEEHALESLVDSLPVEWLVFGESEPVAVADVFSLAGGLAYLIGSAHDDVLSAERVLPDGWLAGGAGDDRFIRPEEASLGVLETAAGGMDTIVFGEAATSATARLRLEHERLFVQTSGGRVELRAFTAADAASALVERFEFGDGTSLAYEDLLRRGIEVVGTPFNDHMTGTSAYDDVLAGGGEDRIETAAGDDRVDAGDGADWIDTGADDDWIAAGRGDDYMRGGPGRDHYLVLRDDGDDLIEEAGRAGEEDTLQFAADVDPGEVSARRAGADLVLELAGGGRVTMRDWFVSDAMRVEEVHFNDGTRWGVAALAGLAGEAVPPAEPPVVEPPVVVEPPFVDPPPESDPTPGVGLPPVVAGPPPVSVDPPASVAPPVSIDPPALSPPPIAPIAAAADPGFPPFPSAEFGLGPAMPSPGAAGQPVEPLSIPFPIGPAAILEPAGIGAASVSVRAMAAHHAGEPPALANVAEGVASPVAEAAPATIEALAAAGFVSPGRPAAAPLAEASIEAVEPEPGTAEETPAEPSRETEPSSPVAAYWRWMHARLDEHLDLSEPEDLGAPPMHEYQPLALAPGLGLESLAPARAVGLRERSVFDARTFDGLKEGFVHLG